MEIITYSSSFSGRAFPTSHQGVNTPPLPVRALSHTRYCEGKKKKKGIGFSGEENLILIFIARWFVHSPRRENLIACVLFRPVARALASERKMHLADFTLRACTRLVPGAHTPPPHRFLFHLKGNHNLQCCGLLHTQSARWFHRASNRHRLAGSTL